ncbi:hypothetical protein [Aliivibrio fischeri]|uniref:hypothetical protein n=1 Tax=Aliivibrio fischeri TaxID=668 RepID=UPI00080DF562|nr:hypothetical protein [Aliivibrio fischeri]OCH42343.1 hypothetical protein A6E02_14255 [Aliivibrio fischeri]
MKNTSVVILVTFTLVVGIFIGLYCGVETDNSLIQELTDKGAYDTLMLVSTIIAVSGTAAATWFAIALYLSWKSQQTEIDLMGIRKDILKNLISIEKLSSRLYSSYRVHANPPRKQLIEEEIGQLFSIVRTDLMMYYTFKSRGATSITYDESLKPRNDFLDSSKELYKYCFLIYSSSSFNYIKSKDSGHILRDVELDIPLDFGGVVTEYEPLKQLINESESISKDLNMLLTKAASDISKESAKSSL